MIEFLIVFGILALVSASEFVLWKLYEWFDGEGEVFLFGTNIVVVTILITLRVLGK